jgi:hypothetical protein
MAITQAMCTSFKKELLLGVHRFGTNAADTMKLALYTSSATLDATTTAYSATNEASGTGYSAGGGSLTGVAPTTSSTTAFTDFADLTFTSSTITARGALLYNSTPSANDESGSALTNPSVIVLNFGSDKTSSNGDFTIQFPTADASSAIIRIA